MNTPYKNIEEKQVVLFENTEWWKEHWVGMPEFNQAKQEAYAEIIIRVQDEQALCELAKLLNQKLTKKTKSLWFPKVERGWGVKGEYVDESNVPNICNK